MDGELTIDRVELGVEGAALSHVAGFYQRQMGLSVTAVGNTVTVRLSGGELEFHRAPSAPWYHFAFLVPGDRFDAALDWARRCLPVVQEAEFPNWDARAVYFKDPAGNPVELIAHHGYQETGTAGEFSPSELRGISEMMVINDDLEATTQQLWAAAGLTQWDGSAEAGITFVGRPAHSLVLSRTGRRVLAGEAGEPYPLAVELTTADGTRARLEIANTTVVRR